MTIDIRGTQTGNKGAQLMLEAIIDRLGGEFELSVPPVHSEYAIRASLGLRQTLHSYRRPRLVNQIGNLLPQSTVRNFGLTRDRDITGVLDASGFAYGDTFGAERSKREATFGSGWRRRGVPKVLLPQAFGPFQDSETRRWAREVVTQANVVFARDAVSRGFLDELGTDADVRLAPDFTIGLSKTLIEPVCPNPFVALVPNSKMITTGVTTEDAYVAELTQYARAARSAGLDVVVVVHEAGDLALAKRVAADPAVRSIFTSGEPRVLKAALGQATGVVASRFHAVVGALSEGVPTLALGWSHKYEELLRDFGVTDWLVKLGADPQERLTGLLEDRAGVESARARKLSLARQVEEMWEVTSAVLSSGGARP